MRGADCPSLVALLLLQARDAERRKEQERGAAILQQQLAERQAQRVCEEELRDQVSTRHIIGAPQDIPPRSSMRVATASSQ
jgi:hypothetical protein